MIVKNISSKSGVQSVQVPVWSQPDQSDLIWYSAKKQSDGTYKVTVELSKHQITKEPIISTPILPQRLES